MKYKHKKQIKSQYKFADLPKLFTKISLLLAVNCFFEQEKSLQLIADYLEPLQNINSELTQ